MFSTGFVGFAALFTGATRTIIPVSLVELPKIPVQTVRSMRVIPVVVISGFSSHWYLHFNQPFFLATDSVRENSYT